MNQSSRSLAAFHLSILSLLSAFLLFQVQPVISKFILPWFGGSPAVWTTCMLFFQVVLFAGYAYAHLLTRLTLPKQAIVHSIFVVAALVCLPIDPSPNWKPSGTDDPTLRILLLLLANVGLPYFVLSSTSPLVQVWFSRAVPRGRPWRLYALSNIGSLAALLSYPFLVEPRFDVTWQTWIWSGVFVLFVGLSLAGVWRDRAVADTPSSVDNDAATSDEPVSRWWHRILWLVLPALGSIALLAATNHVCQDVAVIPFMWVVPLSLYLLTFIICFEHERWYQPVLWAALALIATFAAGGYEKLPSDTKWNWKSFFSVHIDWDEVTSFRTELGVAFAAVFFACMVCHGELTRLKPATKRLTEFYLVMSAGGALGGLFVSLLAPRLFTTYLEWPLILIAVFGMATLVLAREAWRYRAIWMKWTFPVIALAIGGAGVWKLQQWGMAVEPRLERVRNFYGAINIEENWDPGLEQDYRTLTHGGIVHGLQNLGAGYRTEPVTYYGRQTGVGKALESLKSKPDAKVGAVGMGAGTVACYGMQGHTFRFYEINPEIVRLARQHFTYLSDMEARGGRVETILGDARLSLERESNQNFDVLLLDAFSGDSVPVHLLTREAFEIYRRHMKPDGIIVVHVTNSYLSLAPVVEKIAVEMRMHTLRIATEAEGDHDDTDYVLVTNNEGFLSIHPAQPPDDVITLEVPVWTDRRHNLFEILDAR